MKRKPARVGLVLAGGAARGAYEAGVVRYLYETVIPEIGPARAPDVICGTSVGAVNACALAAFADDPMEGVRRMNELWLGLRLADVLRADGCAILAMGWSLLAGGAWPGGAMPWRGGVLDVRPLRRLLEGAIPFERIDEHVQAGRLAALTVSTTEVATGRTMVFVDGPALAPSGWSDPTIAVHVGPIGADHALASAAIPFLFPAVSIDGALHCDGGLRQLVPLAPALRLGVRALVAVSTRFHRSAGPIAEPRPLASPMFLLGKAIDALLLDHLDEDLGRVAQINAILGAGERTFGPGFVEALNAELVGQGGEPMRPVQAVDVRPSRDLGALAAEFVRSPAFARRRGPAAMALRRLAEAEGGHEADLLSYLLFDGSFAGEMIALGRADGRARHDALCAALSGPRAATRRPPRAAPPVDPSVRLV